MKETKKEKVFREIPLNNPFFRDSQFWDRENESYDKIKTAILSVLLLPIRVCCVFLILVIGWAVAHVALLGCSREDLKTKPLVGWRRKCRTLLRRLFRLVYFFISAHWIKLKGKLASVEEAPILVAAPHSSFLDALVGVIEGPWSFLGDVEVSNTPFYGRIIDIVQPIYFSREDPNSKASTIKDILLRMNSLNEWQEIGRLLIFPEGACTNRTSLIQFKPGAFLPGLAVQPVLVRYPNKLDTFTWNWGGPSLPVLLWRSMSQFHTSVEIEFLPTYYPNADEKKDANLYAQNVQELMAKALDLPISDFSVDDRRLVKLAKKCKLSFSSKIIEVSKLRAKLGISKIEEDIVKENFPGSDEIHLNFEEFVKTLKIPADDYSYTLFKIFATPNQTEEEVIDFKEYLLHALILIKKDEAKIELVKVMFMLYGNRKRVDRVNLQRILGHFMKLSTETIDALFISMDIQHCGLIAFDDFLASTKEDIRFTSFFKKIC